MHIDKTNTHHRSQFDQMHLYYCARTTRRNDITNTALQTGSYGPQPHNSTAARRGLLNRYWWGGVWSYHVWFLSRLGERANCQQALKLISKQVCFASEIDSDGVFDLPSSGNTNSLPTCSVECPMPMLKCYRWSSDVWYFLAAANLFSGRRVDGWGERVSPARRQYAASSTLWMVREFVGLENGS